MEKRLRLIRHLIAALSWLLPVSFLGAYFLTATERVVPWYFGSVVVGGVVALVALRWLKDDRRLMFHLGWGFAISISAFFNHVVVWLVERFHFTDPLYEFALQLTFTEAFMWILGVSILIHLFYFEELKPYAWLLLLLMPGFWFCESVRTWREVYLESVICPLIGFAFLYVWHPPTRKRNLIALCGLAVFTCTIYYRAWSGLVTRDAIQRIRAHGVVGKTDHGNTEIARCFSQLQDMKKLSSRNFTIKSYAYTNDEFIRESWRARCSYLLNDFFPEDSPGRVVGRWNEYDGMKKLHFQGTRVFMRDVRDFLHVYDRPMKTWSREEWGAVRDSFERGWKSRKTWTTDEGRKEAAEYARYLERAKQELE
ncbi:MAG: hypothetical protein AAF492_02435 [Verrucomicrobiota bacterium]